MRVGSLVECIKTMSCNYNVVMPKIKSIYTIRDVKKFDCVNFSGIGILLEEIVNAKFKFVTGLEEPYFHIEFFRELLPPIEISIENILEKELV